MNMLLTRKYILLGAAVAALLAVHLLFPGNAPFINDEPVLLQNAYMANVEGRLETKGLLGTVGIHYGPLPTWYYQANFLFTHNPVVMVFVKVLVMQLLLVLGMLWLSRETGYTPWMVVVPLLSPYFYIYSRVLWDNCFLIPFSLLAVAAWVTFVRTHGVRWFGLFLLFVVVLIHIHLMALPLIAALMASLVVCEGAKLLRNKALLLKLGGLAVLGVLVCLQYLLPELKNFRVGTSATRTTSGISSLAGLLTGAKLFSFVGVEHFLPQFFEGGLLPAPVMTVLKWISGVFLFFAGAGLVMSIRSLRERWREKKFAELYEMPVEDKLALAGIIAMLILTVFYLLLYRHPYPHYANAVWPIYIFFSWRFVDRRLWRSWRGRAVWIGHVCGMAILLGVMIAFIQVNRGNRLPTYGACVGNQVAVARRILERAPHSKITTGVDNYRAYPQALWVLLQILQDGSEEMAGLPEAALGINYASAGDASTGEIGVVSLREEESAAESQIKGRLKADLALLAQQPHDAKAHNNAGTAYAQLGRFDWALRHWHRATILEPDYELAHRNLAAAFMRSSPNIGRAEYHGRRAEGPDS